MHSQVTSLNTQDSSPTPDDAQEYLNRGSLIRAVSACQKILKRNPKSIQSWFVLALAHQEQGEHAKAIEDYQQVITLKPDLPEAHYNLGVLQRALRQTEAAIASFKRALELRSHWADAHNNLGNCLLDGHDYNGAVNCYQQAIQFDGEHPAGWLNLSNLVAKGHLKLDADNALSICQRAVQLNPASGQAYYNLGIILDKRYLFDDALKAIERAVELNPANEMWRTDLHARKGDLANAKLPVEYVAVLFDAYADSFDDHLLGKLEYRVPSIIFAEVSACTPEGPLDILDIGCGTGLCGVLFQNRSRNLVGVDLSPKMIDVAREKHVYTALHVASMNDFMATETAMYDLILAADVLIYLGDLSESFTNVHRVLRSGGRFAFSVENYDGERFTLQTSRRFAYSLNYLRELMTAHGFREERIWSGPLRKESGNDVLGHVLVLRK